MAYTKVLPDTLQFVLDNGCENGCGAKILTNKGLPLPCKEWTEVESMALRAMALQDTQLVASGFVRKIDRSNLSDDLRIKKRGIDVGDIRTEASGFRGKKDCNYTPEGIDYEEFEKRFYTVNTGKHLKMCLRELIGTKLQDWVGGSMADFDPENFSDADLADIIVSQIIDKYRLEFVAKFMLLSVYDSPAANQNGDDGILAKAYYQHKNQYFHTLEWDLTGLVSGKTLNAIVGGKKYTESFDTFGSLPLLLADFTNWLNGLKDSGLNMFNASFDDVNGTVVVAANFATQLVDLRIVIADDGTAVDWGTICEQKNYLAPTQLQNAMMINDTPLLFEYETITEANFATLFKKYIKEFVRYMHRNGFDMVTMDSILIGIDPELMLERNDAINNKILQGNVEPNFMDLIGLSVDKFKPLNSLTGTGLFFITVPGNLLMFDDADNAANGMPNAGRVRIKEVDCSDEVLVIFDNPIGSAVEHFGLFASNLCGSPFAIDNDLDNRAPYANTAGVLSCYDDNNRNNCISGEASCRVSASTEVSAEYDSENDETNITVTVNAFSSNVDLTLEYELSYTTSEGTAGTSTASSFIITLPGDQTDSGIVVTVTGYVYAKEGSVLKCQTSIVATEKLGEGTGAAAYCSHEGTGDANNTSAITVIYGIGGDEYNIPFTNAALDFTNSADWAAIELEIEAILPGAEASLVDAGGGFPTVTVSNVPSFVEYVSFGTAVFTLTTTRTC